jgi:hypothetical protein
MNRHFQDARYYLKRAGETATKGVKTELEPVRERFDELTGREDEPDPSRLDEVKTELREIQETAEGEAREAIGDAREKLDEYRGKQTA